MKRIAFEAALATCVLGVAGAAVAGECPFEIPPDAIGEDDPLLVVTETCAQTEGALPRGPNGGCDGPKGPDGTTWAGTYAELPIGVTVTGTLRASDGTQDRDWYLVRGLPTEGTNFIIDYTLSAEAPVRVIHTWIGWRFDTCSFGSASGTVLTQLSECGQTVRRKSVVSVVNATSPEGVFNAGVLAFILRPNPSTTTSGHPCGDAIRYWIRVNEIFPIGECAPVDDPPGVLGTDWFAEDDPVHTMTFSGLPSVSGRQYEDCSFPIPGCRAITGGPCEDDENEFIRLWPGKPMVGRTMSTTGSSSSDWDYYKFEVPARSIVSASIAAGSPYVARVYSGPRCGTNEDCTDPSGVLELQGATLGHCGGRNDTLSESRVLDPGVYTVWVRTHDFVADLPLWGEFHPCAPAHDPFNKYVVRVDLAPAPQCEGDANSDGVVDFNDITSILEMWGADYLPMPGSGIGDADGSGVVDFNDVVAALGNWLGVCP